MFNELKNTDSDGDPGRLLYTWQEGSEEVGVNIIRSFIRQDSLLSQIVDFDSLEFENHRGTITLWSIDGKILKVIPAQNGFEFYYNDTTKIFQVKIPIENHFTWVTVFPIELPSPDETPVKPRYDVVEEKSQSLGDTSISLKIDNFFEWAKLDMFLHEHTKDRKIHWSVDQHGVEIHAIKMPGGGRYRFRVGETLVVQQNNIYVLDTDGNNPELIHQN